MALDSTGYYPGQWRQGSTVSWCTVNTEFLSCHLNRHIQYSIEPLWKLLFEILASKHLSIYYGRSSAVQYTLQKILQKIAIISIDHMD